MARIYGKKFPELQNLVHSRLDYLKVVETIGNEMDMTRIDLTGILPSAAVMVVSVTGSTTSGQPLGEEDLAQCTAACGEVAALQAVKEDTLAFVGSRMAVIAPNCTALLGADVAAQLVGLAGGLVAMAGIPACNLMVMGQQKHHLGGFGSAAAAPHTGCMALAALVQNAPSHLRRKVLKVLSGKTALAARCDAYSGGRDQTTGDRFAADIRTKIEKWLEPAKGAAKKALPRPDDYECRKRGGKRYRRLKERTQQTTLAKELNRRAMGTKGVEYGDDSMGMDTGMASAALRAAPRKEKKGGGAQQQPAAKRRAVQMSSGKTGGTASSLVFTPVHGLELRIDDQQKKIDAANTKWFASGSGFASAKPK